MRKRHERHYLVITVPRDQMCEMYELGSSFPFARITLIKAKNRFEQHGLFGRFVGPAALHIYDDELTLVAILKVFTLAVP